MPELPEVETMRRGLLPIVGGVVVDVSAPPCERRPIVVRPSIAEMSETLAGKRVLNVERYGKRAAVLLEGGLRLVFEPRMTGLLLVADPPTTEHLRLRIRLEEAAVAEFLFWDRRGLGRAYLWTKEEFTAWQAGESLGPDALTVAADVLADRLGNSSRPVKVALLDQKALAGVGNLYAAEVLFLAKISPKKECRRLKKGDWGRLAEAIRSVLEEAVRMEGSTLSDGTYRNALSQDGGYQSRHRVYDKAGNPCPHCKSVILRIVQAQRATFYCPRCQK